MSAQQQPQQPPSGGGAKAPRSRNRGPRRPATASVPGDGRPQQQPQGATGGPARPPRSRGGPGGQNTSSDGSQQQHSAGGHPRPPRNHSARTDPRRPAGSAPHQQQQQQQGAAPAPRSHASTIPAQQDLLAAGSDVPQERFDSLVQKGLVSAETLRGIPHEFMTPVQALSLPIILQGQDCLAQAKTGTGKTIAFLVPSIELLRRRGVTTGVNILIISPTRELAFQIGEEAKTLVKFDQGRIGVQMVVGGTPVNKDVRALQSQPCQILVGTPGRLLDLLQNYNLKAGCSKLKVLILDEADRLLEQGFRQDIERILTYLPQKTSVPRQTLLFSATIPAGVKEIASLALSKDFKFISTVNKSDVDTHQHVAQFLIQAPLANSQAATFSLLQALNAQGKSKVVVFLPTARATQLAYECFQAMRKDFLPLPSWELHSRKSQSARTKTSDAFKDAPRGVLFSSDVSARGMDFPDVAAVVQCGVPQNREQYVHRLGRTARAGKEGEGYLILAPFEEFFVNKLKGMDVQTVTLDNVLAVQPYVDDAYTRVDDLTKNQTYSAWIGYYKGWLKDMRWTSTMLVQAANAFAENIGCRGIPEIPAQTVGKMGLKGVPGLNVVKGIQKGRGGR